MTGLLAGRRAAVTGAGSGIGRAVAMAFGAQGARLALIDQSAEGLARLAAELAAVPDIERPLSVPCDVSSGLAVNEAFADIRAALGGVDVLVCCAGIREIADSLTITHAQWEHTIAVDLNGTFYCCQAAALAMSQGGYGGVIINVASVTGLIGESERPAYTAAKHGVLGLTKSLACDLARHGTQAIPSLASAGTYSANDTVFTVTLRQDVKFSTGQPVTPADVVPTFHRDLTSKLNLYVGEFQPITSVKPKGSDQVVFTFSRPYPSFVLLLGNPEMTIVEASEISAQGTLPANPVFAGQYTTASSVIGKSSYTLTSTPYPYPGNSPSVKTLSFTVVTDPNGRLAQVSGGQQDFAEGINTTNLRSLPSGVAPIAVPAFIFTYLSMNGTSGLTANRNIRKAISLALNRREISEIAWSGFAKPLVRQQPFAT